MGVADTLCSPGWGKRVAEGSPKNLALTGGRTRCLCAPSWQRSCTRKSNGPALAYGEVASSLLVKATFNMEKASLKTGLADLDRITKKLCFKAYGGMKNLVGHFHNVLASCL